jgi:hypothetical protein
LLGVAAVGVHHPDVLAIGALPLAGEGDPVAVRRPVRSSVSRVLIVGQLLDLAAVGSHCPQLDVPIGIALIDTVTDEHQLCPVRRPVQVRDLSAGIGGQHERVRPVGVRGPDVDAILLLADERDPAVARDRRLAAQHGDRQGHHDHANRDQGQRHTLANRHTREALPQALPLEGTLWRRLRRRSRALRLVEHPFDHVDETPDVIPPAGVAEFECVP